MMLTWLLQANLRDRRTLDELMRTLDQLGEAWRAEPVVPFSPALPVLPAEVEAGRIICYGPSFVPRVIDRTALPFGGAAGRGSPAVGSGWRPGIFFDHDSFRWSAMQAQWRDLMFSADGQPTTLGAVIDELDDGARVFVRPDADSKAFDGAVYDDADTLRAVAKACAPELAVIRATPRPIDAEWRCFVVEGEVVAGSEYRRAGAPSLHAGVPPRVAELAELAAGRWLPAAVTCIDVASSGDHFGIVEANCFNAARFYAADLARLLHHVSAYVRALPAG